MFLQDGLHGGYRQTFRHGRNDKYSMGLELAFHLARPGVPIAGDSQQLSLGFSVRVSFCV